MSSNDPLDRTREGPKEELSERTLPTLGPDGGATVPAAPRPSAPPQDPLFGLELGGCRIEGLLGRGAMGAVYRARQLRLDREVAVKVIRPELLTDQRILKRFEVEARTVGRFNSPHVVMVHDVGFEHGVHFLVMEFVKGKNLREHTKLLAGGRLQVSEALPLIRQACKGLEEAQRLGVLHRDIKPDNLMITDRGVLKIADFGIAKPAQDDFSMTMTSELIGTPLYMSPEQCQASPDLDFRSDMYSLGATFYYLLTGEPPIRASSVYELIQTKTKLEHLCLWKALPELDEDHPLSRVIERMTALSREDRYESYEALVQDLALVEQGRTMDIQRPRSKQAQKPVEEPKQQSSRGLAIGVVALLLAAGGGAYAWTQFGPVPEVPTQRGPMSTADTAAEAVKKFASLRTRFAESGPTAALREEVAALQLASAQQVEQKALLADVDQALQIRAKLDALKVPTTLELPFTEVGEHLQQVASAAAVTGKPGPEFTTWLWRAVALARGEQALGASARAKLVVAFSNWQAERQKAAGDVVQIAELGQRLQRIEDARKQLLEALPALKDALQQELPLAAFAEARKGLSGADAPLVVDLGKVIAEIRADFQEQGPIASIENRVQGLRPTDPEQEKARRDLLDEMQRASSALGLARSVRASFPLQPQLPFDDVAAYFAAIEREMGALTVPETGLPKWAAAARDELRDEAKLQDLVLQRCKSTWADWQQRRAAGRGSATDLQGLEQELGRLRAGIEQGKTLFPALAQQLGEIVTVQQLDTEKANVVAAVGSLQWVTKTRDLLHRLDAVSSIAEWRAASVTLKKEQATQVQAATAFSGQMDVSVELTPMQTVVDRWVDADRRIDAVAKALASGNLPAADTASRSGPSGVSGREEFQAFATATQRSLEAFTLLDRELDTKRALALLGEAAAALKVHGALERGAVDRVARWSSALQKLQSAAVGMAAIPAGTALANEPAAAFFLSCTEARQSDFLRFLEDVQAVMTGAGSDPAAQRAALQERLGAFLPAPEVLQRMLDRRTKLRAPEMPIEGVNWFEAAACAQWFHLALPTKAEWALAAFGDGKSHAFPWGNEWKDDDASRNIGSAAVAADSGGLSWRGKGTDAIHHLAGNVAEWLAGEPTASEGLLAGGRYNDNRKEARQRAAGEDFHKASLLRELPGFGFRMVLHPRQFLENEFANGQYPTAAR
jgi:formylglycine-generating enzyme required for sulfatase activity/tRNA A-37 threonylcarbamoyl transferase component Bud32